MHRIIRHMLNRGSSSEQQSQGDPPPVPIPSLAKMSTNLARKSLAAAASSSDAPKVRIGICAMDKKARSKPMNEIVSRLLAYGEFEMVYFGDELILSSPPEAWPEVDCLLSWYSDGFPLVKVQAYADLRRPFLVNDLSMQDVLMDRRGVYQVLRDNNIPTPTHIVVNRDDLPPGADPPGFIEEEDYVELDGVRIAKPFVEKPVSGEDHNIWIFYPSSMGGGVKRLFRKVNDKSSTYDPNHSGNVRRSGSYIYEEFLATGGTDVKVYTVGPRYAHAEARKSPVVDGKVLRSADGKEMRFPVLLTPQEKEIARMVTLAFAQKVCGFDLLRSEKGKSYVCDVNGWSFVKSSKKYYDDASGILRSIILSALAPHRLATAPPAPGGGRSSVEGGSGLAGTGEGEEGPLGSLTKNSSLQELSGLAEVSGAELASLATLSGWDLEELRRTEELAAHEELRCLAAVVRHGDRTPKQKMKVRVTHPRLLALFNKYKDSKGKQAKLKSPHQLQELLDITRQLLAELEQEPAPQQQQQQQQNNQAGAAEDQPARKAAAAASPGVTWELPDGWPASEEEREELREKFRIVRTVLEQGGQFSGINRKVQFKPLVWGPPVSPSVTSGGAATARTSSAGGASDPQQQPALFSVPSLAVTASSGSGYGHETRGGSSSAPAGPKGPQPQLKEALMILKWGGVLTHAGRQQAEDLGRIFRLIMYPRYGAAGGGLLRLHSTYRHDLKIYSSDEGRVQSSAAAFTKGLLDLEGESLTPILVSLVQKDASMLDAFGKGASEDIKNAKQVLYSTMTWDPAAGGPAAAAPSAPITPTANNSPAATPARLSPSTSAAAPIQAEQQQQQQAGGKGGGVGVNGSTYGAASSSSSTTDMSVLTTMTDPQQEGPSTGPSQQQQQQQQAPSASAGPVGAPQRAATPLAAAQQLLQQQQGPGAPPLSSLPSMEAPGGGGGGDVRGDIPHMPQDPLQHLRSLHTLMKLLVDQLRDMCVAERPDPAGDALARYSSLSQDPREWACVPGHPCSGERLLLMFDRWQKLTKSFFKKGRFDISKVPDIYDSAKHDVLHNSHLALAVLPDLYYEAKVLADAIIPNEYGLDPAGKLNIGSKICSELLGKLLSDLESMRQESLATMAEDEGDGGGLVGGEAAPLDDDDIGRVSLQDEAMLLRQVGNPGTTPGASPAAAGSSGGGVPGGEEGEEGDFREEPETIHRLCPMYASDINSPLRHVRTRIYFTSESHMHSLLNVLRYCHLDVGASRPAQSTPSSAPLSTMGSVDPSAGAAFAAAAAATAAGGSSSGAGGAAGAASSSGSRGAVGATSAPPAAAAADGVAGESRGASPRVTGGNLPYYFNSSVPPSAALSHSSSTNSRAGDAAAADLAAAAAAAVGSAAAGGVSGGPMGAGRGEGRGGSSGGSSSGSGRAREPLLSDEAAQMLDATSELDYLTQVVFRMYENKAVPADHPNRFRVEVLFSAGASYNPVTTVPPLQNHTLPAKPRMSMHRGTGVSLAAFKGTLGPRASTKRQPQPQAYALTVGLKAPSPQVAKAAAGALG